MIFELLALYLGYRIIKSDPLEIFGPHKVAPHHHVIEVREGKFCEHCGAKLASGKFCPDCGKEVS